MIIFRPTWTDWVHLLALRHGRVLDESECTWLLWEGTAWPVTYHVDLLGPQVHEALAQYAVLEGSHP